jgi:branched-chain amino acid transport system ATP-binding protein
MLKIEDLHAYYGKSHVLHGVNFDVQAGEIVALLGRNGSGRSTTAKAIMGLVDWQGTIEWKGQNLAGKKAFEIAHLGLGYVPESRDIFPSLTVHQNLLLGQKGAGKAAAGLRRHVRHVPAPEGAPAHRGRRDVGRRAADADAVPHADGRPRPHHHRRAHRGPGAQDRRAGGRVPEKLKERGVSVLLIEQKLTIAMHISDRALVMGHGASCSTARPTPARRRGVRKEWLEVCRAAGGRLTSDSPGGPQVPNSLNWTAEAASGGMSAARALVLPPSPCRSAHDGRIQVHGDIAVISLNNPPVNGLGYETRIGITNALEKAWPMRPSRPSSHRRGKAFSGGADIREFNSPKAMQEPTCCR